MAHRPLPCTALVAAVLLACGAAAAQPSPPGGLRLNEAMIQLDYQVVRVRDDQPIDLLGMHVLNKVGDGLYLGAGLFAPLFKGVYGGFTAYDISALYQHRLGPRLFASTGLSLGGGAGGRSVENAKTLSGTGGFYKATLGLGYAFDDFTLGVNVAKLRFSGSAIGGTQANVFVQIPYSYLAGPFDGHGRALAPDEAGPAAAASGERMLTVAFDHYRQRQPKGTYQGSFNTADLQFAQFFARDTYWLAALGVGWRGLPLYNQVMGGLGQRLRLSPRFTLYGQLALGSGGYAPERIDTDAGFLLHPRVALEFALARDLGLALSAGYLAAPEGTSRNLSVGLGLTRHFRAGPAPGGDAAPGRWQAYRVALFQQIDSSVRFLDTARSQVKLIGIQAEAMVDERWYLPLQASVAYNTYLGYPGYGELLGGIGLQTAAGPGQDLQGFGELMAGTNVHGLAVKAGAGLRYNLSERVGLRLTLGRIMARSESGNRFSANSLSLGLDYRFALPTW